MTHADLTARDEARFEDGLPAPRRYFAIFALLVTLMLVVLDGAITNVALPTITAELNAPTSQTVWVVTAYQLVLVMALLPMAFLGEAIGPKRLFTIGVTVFTLASALCALAPTINWLIAARVLQGLGAAPIMSLTIALLRHSLPARMVGTIIGFNSMVVALASALGPAIGAAILSVGSWPWLFAVNVPVGLVVLAASVALIGPSGSGRKADVVAMGLNALAFAGPIAGRFADRVDTARLCTLGGIAMAVGLGLAAAWPTELVPVLACLMLAGAGFGFVQVPNNRNMLLAVPRARAGAAGGSQGTARLLGQTIGGLAMSIMFALLPDESVPRLGLAFAAGASALSALISLRRAALPYEPSD